MSNWFSAIELLDVRELERHDTVRLQQQHHSGDKVIEVGNLREDIVADDEVGIVSLRDQLAGQAFTEKVDARRDTAINGDLGDIRGRLDAEHRHAERKKVLQEIAVVARKLDRQALRSEIEPLLDHVAIGSRMRHPAHGVGRKVGVLGEDVRRADVFLQLHEEAFGADKRVQRKVRLHAVELVGGNEAFAKWRHSEIDECRFQRFPAQPAGPTVRVD